MAGKTLYDKLWDAHVVSQRDDGSALIYIDRHIVHEVTSPQAFEGLRLAGRKPWRLDSILATPITMCPPPPTSAPPVWPVLKTLSPASRCKPWTQTAMVGILEFKINDQRQGIVHVVGPGPAPVCPA